MMVGFCFTCNWSAPRDSSMLLSMSRMLLMHRVLNKELNNDVIDLQRENDTTKLKSVQWESYFSERQKMLRIFPAKPTAPKMIMKTPTIQNLSGENKLFVQKNSLESAQRKIMTQHYLQIPLYNARSFFSIFQNHSFARWYKCLWSSDTFGKLMYVSYCITLAIKVFLLYIRSFCV